ncbi:MAG TPA: hypothetical protein DIW43_11210, partial [Spongiibacteraceae bacterium]|nr:hypothetical protein [Spongiibacteraceae bacterium]
MHQLDYRQALKANINARSDNPDGYVSSFANVRRPDWLLNDSLDDMEWRLEPSVKSYPNSHFTLNWDLFSDSNLLGLDGYWRDLARWCTYSYMESDANECNKTSSLVAWARLNRSLFVWLCDARKCRRIEDITRADLALWEEYVRSQNLAASSVEAKLGCFKSLFTMREVFGVGIGFDPYMQNGSLIRRAKQIGAPDGHTETIEPEVLFVLVDAALNNLKNYKDVLSRLELKRQVYEEFSGGAGAYKARAGESVVRLYDDVEALYASGLVIIFVL